MEDENYNSSSIILNINNNNHNNNNCRLASCSPSSLKPVLSPSPRHWKFSSSASSSVAGSVNTKEPKLKDGDVCMCDSRFRAFSALMETEEGSTTFLSSSRQEKVREPERKSRGETGTKAGAVVMLCILHCSLFVSIAHKTRISRTHSHLSSEQRLWIHTRLLCCYLLFNVYASYYVMLWWDPSFRTND